jgi:hypothetical protein
MSEYKTTGIFIILDKDDTTIENLQTPQLYTILPIITIPISIKQSNYKMLWR